MREALAPYILQLSEGAVVHQWAPKQYVQRSSSMPEPHARLYREHAAQHAQQLLEAAPVQSCSSAAAPKCDSAPLSLAQAPHPSSVHPVLSHSSGSINAPGEPGYCCSSWASSWLCL